MWIRRKIGFSVRFADSAPPEKQVQVKKQHEAKVNGEAADFAAQHLHQMLGAAQVIVYFQNQEGKADIEQVKTCFKKRVGTESDLFASAKDVQHEHLGVLEQCARHIISEAERNRQVNEISPKHKIGLHDVDSLVVENFVSAEHINGQHIHKMQQAK